MTPKHTCAKYVFHCTCPNEHNQFHYNAVRSNLKMFFHFRFLQRKNFNFGCRQSFQRVRETNSASNSMKFNQNHERANQEQNLDDSWKLIKSFATIGTMFGVAFLVHKYLLINEQFDIKCGTSSGSGFIVNENGVILTNAHVVCKYPIYAEIQVQLHDGREFVGSVDNFDKLGDLATVRINCNNLPALKLGVSSTLRAGQSVFTIGSPIDLKETVSVGVVSSPKRTSKELGMKENGINYIQTDTPITFGNSGGPLINMDGKVVASSKEDQHNMFDNFCYKVLEHREA